MPMEGSSSLEPILNLGGQAAYKAHSTGLPAQRTVRSCAAMAAPRNNALALSSLMSPAAPTRTAQKRKAEEAGIEPYAAPLSLDALSAAAAAAATTVVAPGPTMRPSLHVGDDAKAFASQLSALPAQSSHESNPYSYGAPPPPPGTAYITDGNGEEGHYDDDGGIIRCICGCDDDDGFTVQCDRCLVWQHCACLKMTPDSLPDEYLCEQCFPRPVDVNYARELQQRRKQEEARKEMEEQQRLASSARRSSAAPQPSYAATPSVSADAHPLGPQPTPKDNRGRKASQSEPATGDIDYFSGHANAASNASTANKSAKRKTSTSAAKSSKRPTAITPAAPVESTPPVPTTTPKEPRPRERDEDDILDAQERFEAWHIEFTPVPANVYSDRHTRAALDAVANGAPDLRLRAFEVGTGKVMAPLADPADEELEIQDSLRRSPGEPQARRGDQGLSVVGNECVPVEIEAASLADVTQRVTVRYIPEGVASGMFAQVQSAEHSPATPHYAWSASQNIPRPTVHGLYADGAISAGTFITEFRGEISHADNYRADPINQYAALGTPKPHVHILPPPLNVAIDARRYGTEARFARPSCHPNAVLRPVLLRTPTGADGLEDSVKAKMETDPPGGAQREVLFGIFAISDINRGHEITLGWEWDDLHIVHYLPELIKEPPRVSRRAVSPVKDVAPEPITFPYAGTAVAAKMDAVTSAICSVTLCACLGPASSNSSSAAAAAATYFNPTQLTQSNLRKQDCALAQMVRVAHGMELLQVIPSAKSHRKSRPPDFSPLIGRRRWWRPLPLPPAPASSIKAEDEGSLRDAKIDMAVDSDGDQDMDLEQAEDISRESLSDNDRDDDQRSEASSLTEPLSDSFDASEAAQRLVADSSLSTAAKEKPADVAEDEEQDRPIILPLKKRVAGTRLKATFFDADFASDNSDDDSHDILSQAAVAARKQGGRLRTTSRSTRIAKDPRRRPLRSTPDPEDESDAERRNSKIAKKMRQKRDAKLQARMRKPKKDDQPSSPLSSLSSQASLSSLDSDEEDEDENSEGGSEDSGSGETSNTNSGSSTGSDDSDSDSDSSGSTSNRSSNRSVRRGKKSTVQERARKRAAKFRADIAALGDSDTSSDDSAIPAGQRKQVADKEASKARKSKPAVKPKVNDRSPKKSTKKSSTDKRQKEHESKSDRTRDLQKKGSARREEGRTKKPGTTKQPRKTRDGIKGDHDAPSASSKLRKPKPSRQPIESLSESESDAQEVEVKQSKAALPTIAQPAAEPTTSAPSSKLPRASPAPLDDSAAKSTEATQVLAKAEGTNQAAGPDAATATDTAPAELDQPVHAAVAAPPPTQAPAPEPPKPEAPRKKLSLADYKKRLAEKKVTEVVAAPPVPEVPAAESVPTIAPAPDTDAGTIEKMAEAPIEVQEAPPAPVPGPTDVAMAEEAVLDSEKPADTFRAPDSPVKPRAVSPAASFASTGPALFHGDLSDRRPSILPRQGDRGWSRLSSPSRDEETETPASSRQLSMDSTHRPSGSSRWGNPPSEPVRTRPTMLTGANTAPADVARDRDAFGPPSFGRGRPFGRPVPPSPSEDRMDTDQPPRYGGAIPSADAARREMSPTRPEHGRSANLTTLGSAWQAVESRPRFGGNRLSDASDHARLGAGFRPATTATSSPESTRPELSIAGRAAAAVGPNRIPLGGGSAVPTGPAGLQPFNPPRGPRALMGSSIMAAPVTTMTQPAVPAKDGFRSEVTPAPASASTSGGQTPIAARLSGGNAVPATPGHAASGPNKISGPPGPTNASASGWTRISVNTNVTPATGVASASSTSAYPLDRPGASTTPASLRADLMNFDGVPKGPASMRGESSGSSSYDDYEYFGGRDRGRGGWRGPRVRKRGGGRGRGWSIRP
ncbi:SET domain-containing protein 3 [Tilletia horrida]|nr:SET domain-containing protein 3 [Tilletia horrida]